VRPRLRRNSYLLTLAAGSFENDSASARAAEELERAIASLEGGRLHLPHDDQRVLLLEVAMALLPCRYLFCASLCLLLLRHASSPSHLPLLPAGRPDEAVSREQQAAQVPLPPLLRPTRVRRAAAQRSLPGTDPGTHPGTHPGPKGAWTERRCNAAKCLRGLLRACFPSFLVLPRALSPGSGAPAAAPGAHVRQRSAPQWRPPCRGSARPLAAAARQAPV